MGKQRAWLRRLLPVPFTHVPSEAELVQHSDVLTRAIVMQHAEGSVLLGEGKFEITGDLLVDDADQGGRMSSAKCCGSDGTR